MTKRDLYRIILKLFGLYLLFNLVAFISQAFSMLFYDPYSSLIYVILSLVDALFTYLFIFKPDIVITLLRLDKGYDTDLVNLGLSSVVIYRAALVILALLLFMNNFSAFITNVFYAFKNSIENGSNNALDDLVSLVSFYKPDYYVMMTSAINLILGFALITNVNRLALKLEKINSKI